MRSVNYNGEWLDWKFTQNKKLKSVYNFYIGDMFIGQIFRLSKHNWSPISFYKNDELTEIDKILNSVNGFSSRINAAIYLLKINKLIKEY